MTERTQEEIEQWKRRAHEWKDIADREASRCREEYLPEITRLRTENKRLNRLLATKG